MEGLFIRDLNIFYGREGIKLIKENDPQIEDGLYVRVKSDSNNKELKGINILWKGQGKTLVNEYIESFLHDIHFKVSDKYSDNSVTLLDSILKYMKSISADEVAEVARFISGGKNHQYQSFVDTFVCQISGYIASIYLMKEFVSWSEIPFEVAFPFEKFDINILSRGLFEYIKIPLQGLILSGYSGLEIILFSQVVDFINAWDVFFDEGEKFDMGKVCIDISKGFFDLCINMARLNKERMEKTESELVFLRDSLSQMQQIIAEMENKMRELSPS